MGWLGWLATFSFVNFALILFRSGNIDQSFSIYAGILNFDGKFIDQLTRNWIENSEFREYALSLIIAFPVFLLTETICRKTDFNQVIEKLAFIKRWSIYLLFTLLIFLLGVLKLAPQFIYFQF
jgi:hypothetical protein